MLLREAPINTPLSHPKLTSNVHVKVVGVAEQWTELEVYHGRLGMVDYLKHVDDDGDWFEVDVDNSGVYTVVTPKVTAHG